MRFIEEDSNFDVQFGSFIQVGDGEDGATFYPSVDADGNLSWTNNKGLPNPHTVNIKGAKGNQGEKGEDGKDGVNGKDGKDGADGHTPIKGVDYFTEADKAELVADVIATLPNAEGVGF